MITVAIVGRPNVGKSTLFNRLAGKQLAIVDDTPGVTRDWRTAEGHLYDRDFRIIDTAGLEESRDRESIPARMRRQTEAALDEADIILFVVDGRAGIVPADEHFAAWLRKKNVPVILGVNKCETEMIAETAKAEAYALGLGDPVAFSAAHGLGFEDLYDALSPYFTDEGETDDSEDEEGDDEYAYAGDLDELEGREDFDFAADEVPPEDTQKPVKLAIVGRPNAGKSTLLNALLQQERTMTGPEAGITRDAIAVDWQYGDRVFRLVDTAGLRRKSKINEPLERMATRDTLRAIRLAQIVILMVDADILLERQDLTIAEHVLNEGRALVVAVNKWDAVKDRNEALERISYRLETSLGQIQGLPVVTISALKGKNLDKLMEAALTAYEIWNRRVPTGRLNRWLARMESHHPAPLVQGRPNRLKYITQIKARPPTFALWVSRPKAIPESYRRYLVNGLRNDFDMPGAPVRLLVRTSKNPYN